MKRHPEARHPYPQPAPGPDGRRRCRWCWGAISNRRRQTWCGDDCVREYREHHDWKFARKAVFKRDQGVCRLCGTDVAWLSEVVHWLRIGNPEFWNTPIMAPGLKTGKPCLVRPWLLLSHGLLGCSTFRDPWECDHIEAKADGGPDHPDNLRLLCIRCHKERTKVQARDRAAARRAAKRKALA